MDKNYNIDELENFLNQEMKEEELTNFKQRLETEKGLKEEVDFHASILGGIQHSAELDFRALVQNTREEMLQEENKVVKNSKIKQKPQAQVRSLGSRRVLALAASFALLLVAAWALFLRPISPERAFANNFDTPKDVLSIDVASRLEETGFGTNEAALKQLQTAMQTYQSENFEQARQQLGAFQAQYPNSEFAEEAAYYEALSAMNTQDYEIAQAKLVELANNSNFSLQTDARWYLALNSLNIGKIEAARTLLESLQSDSKHGTAAQGLLRRLR